MVTIDKDGSVPPEPLRPNGDGDAVRQLTRAIERLRNYRELSDSTVNVNLKYVIHLVGEMHCRGTSISPICRAAWTPRGTTTSFS